MSCDPPKPLCAKPRKVTCDVCRTINLAEHLSKPRPDMQVRDKQCVQIKKDCPVHAELRLNATCIKVCTKEDYKIKKTGVKPLVHKVPHYGHGKLMYGVKAGILLGAAYFTYNQGIWGSQQDVTECLHRWNAYIVNWNSRRPPTFDRCGNVIRKENRESLITPVYNLYKSFITTCFAGVVKMPVILKCKYLDYLNEMERAYQERLKQKKIM